MTTREPTGYLSTGVIGPELIIARRIPFVIDAVWNQITDPELLGTWYGTYEGDPATGTVTLTTREAPDQPGDVQIQHCEAPNALAVTLGDRPLSATLSAAGDETELEFRLRLDDSGDAAADLGPAWEYHLDRLIVALEGGDPDTLQWEDYHPALCTHYGRELPEEPGQMPAEN